MSWKKGEMPMAVRRKIRAAARRRPRVSAVTRKRMSLAAKRREANKRNGVQIDKHSKVEPESNGHPTFEMTLRERLSILKSQANAIEIYLGTLG